MCLWKIERLYIKKVAFALLYLTTRKIRQQFTTLKHILMAKSKSYSRTLPRTHMYQKQELTVWESWRVPVGDKAANSVQTRIFSDKLWADLAVDLCLEV